MSIKGVIFDFGGVIIHYPPNTFRKSIAKFLKLDFEIVNKEIDKIDLDFATGKISEKEFWKRLCSALNIVVSEKDKKNFITDEFFRDAWLNKDVEKIVIALKNSGYKLGIISNIEKPHAKYSKVKHWFKHFSPVILSCEVGLAKPDERIYKLMLEKLQLNGNECIYIDDRTKFLGPAEKLGMKTILFQNAKQLRKELINNGIRFKR